MEKNNNVHKTNAQFLQIEKTFNIHSSLLYLTMFKKYDPEEKIGQDDVLQPKKN